MGKKKPLKKATKKPTIDKSRRLRAVPLGRGINPLNISEMHSELLDMQDVLLGHEDPPVDAGHLTLMEVADAYFARASEMTMLIQAREREGLVTKGDDLYKFRTGELRTFMELTKRAADLGSRRLTKEQLRFEQSRLGRDSRGWNDYD